MIKSSEENIEENNEENPKKNTGENIGENKEGTFNTKEKRKQQRLNILKYCLPIIFIVWVAAEFTIAFSNTLVDKDSLKDFAKALPFFLTTILGVIIGSSLE